MGLSFVKANRGITLNGNATLEVADATSGNYLVYAGVVAMGANQLTKAGPGTLALDGTGGGAANATGTGTILVAEGTLKLRFTHERISDAMRVSVSSGATFNLDGYKGTIGSLAGAGSVDLRGAGSGGGGGSLIAGGDNTSTTFSGVISGSGGTLTKKGSGTLTLSAANTYSGGTTVSAGTLDVTHDGGLGSGDVSVTNGATVKLESGATSAYIAASADLLLSGASPAVNLAYTGTNTIHALSFDGGATWKAVGIWGAPGSGAAHTDSRFAGTGKLNVTTGPASSTTLLSDGSPAVYGAPVTFSATVARTNGTPTGTVTFKDGAAVLGTETLISGQATFTTNRLTVAGSPHTITAVYGGDNDCGPSTSAGWSQAITWRRSPSRAIRPTISLKTATLPRPSAQAPQHWQGRCPETT